MEKETLIMNKLNILTNEVAKLKEQMADITLTDDDIDSLDQAENDPKESPVG